MSSGTIPESAVYVFGGILAIIIIAGIVLGVITQVRNLRAQGTSEKVAVAAKAEAEVLKVRAEAAVAIQAARIEASKETSSQIAFEQLTKAVKSMDDTVSSLSKGLGDKVGSIQKEQETICRRVDRIADSTRSAHKRIDEHRKVDHAFTNGHYVEPAEETETEPRL